MPCPRCRAPTPVTRLHCQGASLDPKGCKMKGCHFACLCHCELEWVEPCWDHGVVASTAEQLGAREG